jgi:DNA-binding response OmpR family regulator
MDSKPNRDSGFVLVVEDDLCLQPVLEKLIMSAMGQVRVIWSTEAEVAERVLLAAEHQPLAILADFYLDGNLTGLDFWRFCQNRFDQVPFAMVSNLGLDHFFKLVGPRSVAPTFLPKPFYAEDLRRLLATFRAETA